MDRFWGDCNIKHRRLHHISGKNIFYYVFLFSFPRFGMCPICRCVSVLLPAGGVALVNVMFRYPPPPPTPFWFSNLNGLSGGSPSGLCVRVRVSAHVSQREKKEMEQFNTSKNKTFDKILCLRQSHSWYHARPETLAVFLLGRFWTMELLCRGHAYTTY